MADVITRFRLETSQYDSKLRDSAKSLSAFSKQAELAGKDFDKFSKGGIEAARALGQVESGANNTKDKLKDLVNAYNDVAKAYNKLTEEQRHSDFAKAMAQSLEQLQGRIKETKRELYSLGDAAKGGGLFGNGGLTGMLQVAGGNLLSKGISMLAGDLTDTIQKSIELARQGEGVRLAFERLNQPGLLDNLKQATHGTVSELELMKAAVKFDDFKLPVEQLGTLLAFAQKKAKDTGQSVDDMVDSIVTGLGRKSLMILDNLGLSAAQIKDKMAETGDMTKAVAEIIKEQMSEAGDYVETAADRAAIAAAEASNKMEDLGRQAIPVAEAWAGVWNDMKTSIIDLITTAIGPLTESIISLQNIWNNGWEDKLTNSPYNLIGKNVQNFGYQGMGSLQSVKATGGYVEVTDKNTGAVIGGQHFENLSDKNAIKAWQKSLTKTPKNGGSKKTLPTYDEFELRAIKNDQIIESEKEAGKLFKDMPSPYKMIFNEIKKQIIDKKDFDYGKDISTDWVVNSKGQLVNKKQGKGKDSESNFVKGIDNVNDTLSNVGGSINNIFGSLQQMGIEIPQGIASVLGALNIITSILTFIQSVVAIKSILPFAGGGLVPHAAGGYMVPGNYYSGDVTPIMANAGELILNKSQQNNIASQLTQAGGGGRLVAKLKGRDILISLERELSETGKGQLATWR